MPYCTNCGTEEREGQQFCAVCGARKGGSFSATPMPPMSSDEFGSEAQVRVGISLEPPRQSRWSVLFRAVLLLPLFVVAVGVEFVAFFVTVAAWFCALFTGRVPDSQQRFLTRALRFYCNILSYAFLLSSRWPGLTFNAKPDDQVSIEIDHVKLRRWSVFFRLVLGYPATLVGSALNLGSYPLLVVAWVWGVVAGREPRSIHQALALVLRYQIRLQAYSCLLTPTQPFRGFLGDGDEKSLKSTQNSSRTTSPSLTPPVPPTNDPMASPRSSTTSLSTRWFVAKAARVLVVLSLVMCVPLYFVSMSIENPFVVRLQDFVSRNIVTTTHHVTLTTMSRFESSVGACPSALKLQCQQRAATRAYSHLSQQSASLFSNNVFVPSGALSSVKKYESALATLENELFTVESSNSLVVQARVVNSEIPVALAQVNRDFHTAVARLGG